MKFIKIMLAAATSLAAFGASAATTTYTLPNTEITKQIKSQIFDDDTSLALTAVYTPQAASAEFTYNGLTWKLDVTLYSYKSTKDVTLGEENNYLSCIQSIKLSTSSLVNFSVKEIDVTAMAKYTRPVNSSEKIDSNLYDVVVEVGNYSPSQPGNTSTELTESPTYKFENINTYADSETSIALNVTDGYYARCYLPTIVIAYDSDDVDTSAAAAPSYYSEKTMLYLTKNEGQTVYYAIGDGEWQEYDDAIAITGIDVSNLANGSVVRYYAVEAFKPDCEVQTYTVNNTDELAPLSVADAVKRYESITLSGYIVGQTATYTLIADTADGENAIAVDNSQYGSLQAAGLGTAVTVTGRTSDYFGCPSLTSVSAVEVASNATTGIGAIDAAENQADAVYYDLSGRRTTTATPGIRIARGVKVLR
jgi:hypothetical protein